MKIKIFATVDDFIVDELKKIQKEKDTMFSRVVNDMLLKGILQERGFTDEYFGINSDN